jgi:lipopolysaccharide transport system permease protein
LNNDITYSSISPIKNLNEFIPLLFWDIRRALPLGWRLAARDIKAQYRQAALGMVWLLLIPLANTAVWLLLSTAGLITNGVESIPYPVYVFTGTLIWSILADSINVPLMQITAAKAMLVKLNFPRESLIISGVIQTAFGALIKTSIAVVSLMAFGFYPNIETLFAILSLGVVIVTGTFIGIVISPLGALYSDIQRSLPFLIQFLMFLSPVVIAVPTSGLLRDLMLANPLSNLVEVPRSLMVHTHTDQLGGLIMTGCISIVLTLVAWVVLKISFPRIIERMGG